MPAFKSHLMGPLPQERIHTVYPGSVFVSPWMLQRPACPNSVIEAGVRLPVVAFAGSLPELVTRREY
jgi:hypothetical protein